jgi:hypothetical protein
MVRNHVTPMQHLMIMVSAAVSVSRRQPLAIVGTLSKGYDLDYVWKQVDPSLAMNPAANHKRAGQSDFASMPDW